MSYRRAPQHGRRSGSLAGIPSSLVVTGANAVALKTGDPSAVLAAGALEAALTGKLPSYQSAVSGAITTVATVGAAAACAATGAGAAVAPVCGFIGGTIGGAVGRMIFGSGPSCGAQLRAVRDGAYNGLVDRCKNDKQCQAELQAAAQRYAERRHALCALSDNWAMAPTIRAEAAKLGLRLGTFVENGQAFGSPTWITFVQDRFTSEAGAAILAAKMRRWEADARAAKAVADAEYDALVRVCPKPGIRLPGTTTPCEKKAASTATVIAAQGYLFATSDGAGTIAASQSTALRQQFLAEVAQDKLAQTLAAKDAADDEKEAAAARAVLTQRILGAEDATRNRTLVGIGLLAAAALGGVYAYQKGAFR